MGFGTGLNAILTYEHSMENKLKINYQTIDSNPLAKNEIKFLNYSKFFGRNYLLISPYMY